MHLARRINGHPEPEDLRVAAQARAQFIQLQMGEHKIAEGALVLPLDMVDKSTSSRELISGWFYPHAAVQIGHFIL
jgi:hypothetical protein